jgi:predicted esterase
MDKDLDFVHKYLPASGSPPAETLLLFHGTGGDEESMIQIGQMVSQDAGLLSPRGKVLENGMPRFFRRLSEGVFDQEDLKLRTKELAVFINSASNEYGFDLSNLSALGYSNGANIISSLILTYPGLLPVRTIPL